MPTHIETVADLIATLAQFPPDARVAAYDAYGAADGVEIRNVETSNGIVVIGGSSSPIYAGPGFDDDDDDYDDCNPDGAEA